jgi:hypothetical protein
MARCGTLWWPTRLVVADGDHVAAGSAFMADNAPQGLYHGHSRSSIQHVLADSSKVFTAFLFRHKPLSPFFLAPSCSRFPLSRCSKGILLTAIVWRVVAQQPVHYPRQNEPSTGPSGSANAHPPTARPGSPFRDASASTRPRSPFKFPDHFQHTQDAYMASALTSNKLG